MGNFTKQDAEFALIAMGFADFPTFAKTVVEEKGEIPTEYCGQSVDGIAGALGFAVLKDRKRWFILPQAMTATELLARKIDAPPFAVTGLLPSGLCILSAPSKVGKSWLALDLCLSIAAGRPFMGRDVTQGSALYLDLEGSPFSLQGRLKKLTSTAQNLHCWFEAPRLGHGLEESLSAWMQSVEKPRVIVIDVLQMVKPQTKGGQTAYESDYAIYAPLNHFALDNGIAIVAVTHNRKASGMLVDDYEMITGSVAQMGAASTTWLITGKRGEDRTFKATGRFIRETEEIISFNSESCRWVNLGDAEEAANRRAEKEFADSPIRKTLHHIINRDGGAWLGTYADLWGEIADYTGKYPFEDARKLAVGMRPMLSMLETTDGIHHRKDHHSQNHRFFIKGFIKGE